LHVPRIHKVKVKKRYYQAILILGSIGILIANQFFHHYEGLIASVTSVLFALDPTIAEKPEIEV
jgi:hypothetical protein